MNSYVESGMSYKLQTNAGRAAQINTLSLVVPVL